MPDKLVAVTFAKQETLFFCGPATAQMVLSALGPASPATPPSWQSQLWDYITANTGAARPSNAPSDPTAPAFPSQKCEWCFGQWKCWSTTPAVLVKLLNASQGVAQYSISTHRGEEPATGVLLNTIDRNLPAVALVYGWQHWLVVDGYRHDEPQAVPVAGRNLNGVYIRDPEATAAIHYVRWTKWQDVYLSFIPCGTFKNKMVVLEGLRLPRPAPPPPSAPANVRALNHLSDSSTSGTQPMKSIIPAAEALRHATEQIGELRASRLGAALVSAQAKTAHLVQRLDEPDLYYYIVTFEASANETARMIVDAFDGTFQEASGIERPGDRLAPYHPAPSALARLQTDSATDALRFRVRTGMVGAHPVLVWKPCGQSSTPFLPFYQLSVGDSFVYYRLDGQLYDALTEGPA